MIKVMIKRKIFFVIISLMLLCLLIGAAYFHKRKTVGKAVLHVESGVGIYLDIVSYGTRIQGLDKDGVTYFFLPSYADILLVDMSDSPGKIYLEDGSQLCDTALGVIRNVKVDLGDGELTPWKVCFMKSANLHSIFLDMKGGDISEVNRDDYKEVSLRLISPLGKTEFEDSRGLIKGRGNATWEIGEGFAPSKLPYEISFQDKHGIGSFSPRKKWVLLANAYEGTGILNKMVFDTAKEMDMPFVTDSEWADVYADGVYLGNYLICSEVQQSGSSIADTGGYIIEKDDVYSEDKLNVFKTPFDTFTVKAPYEVSDAELTGLNTLADTVDRELRHKDPSLVHIDSGSFAKWYILEELFFNEDALITSCFFYTDHQRSKLYAGPPWDFDCVCGEGANRYLDYTGSILDEDEERKPLAWYSLLYKGSPVYRQKVHDVFIEYEPVFQRLITTGIDEYFDKVSASVRMNNTLYGRNGYGPDYTVQGYYDSVSDNFRYTRYFLCNRLLYLSEQWGTDKRIPVQRFDNGSRHSVSFVFPDGHTEQLQVDDGSTLEEDMLPDHDKEGYEGWAYEANDILFSPFLPVYEDVTLYLKEL